MKVFIKHHWVIILAFALPISLILLIAISTYLPGFFVSTDYNFVYTTCTDHNNQRIYDCEQNQPVIYTVSAGKIVAQSKNITLDPAEHNAYTSTTRFFLHDTTTNESHEITLTEATTLQLSELLTSPDGVTVSSHYSGGGDFFIFGGGYNSFGYYLTKGSNRSKLNLINNPDRYYYQDNFKFIGWVLTK
jgi:hypothetical protein